MSATSVDKLSYKQASDELNAIVEYVEGADVDLDELVPKLKRAAQIVTELDRRIKSSKAQVETIVPRLGAIAAGEEIAGTGGVAGRQGVAGKEGHAGQTAFDGDSDTADEWETEDGTFDGHFGLGTGMDDELS
ncbi:MAG: exodeoxyribonuclease VII small subunit [Actinobacteria bacterium]|nr:exodeoxyribonuclease VII small subunit [Actinomycetota bacterium]